MRTARDELQQVVNAAPWLQRSLLQQAALVAGRELDVSSFWLLAGPL